MMQSRRHGLWSLARRLVISVVAGTLVVTGSLVVPVTDAGATKVVKLATTALRPSLPSSQCPWVYQSRTHEKSPSALASEVLSRMTLSQKVGLLVLHNTSLVENLNNAVPSLCIPAFTLTDGPAGVGNSLPGVTQFPSPIGVAATFDPALAGQVGAAMAQETRAKGFDVLQAPNLNLARVPQSGRIFETFGEDPLLTSVMGVATIKGIQREGVMANAKHFTGYTQETARTRLNQIIDPRALAELYNAPFKAAVQ